MASDNSDAKRLQMTRRKAAVFILDQMQIFDEQVPVARPVGEQRLHLFVRRRLQLPALGEHRGFAAAPTRGECAAPTGGRTYFHEPFVAFSFSISSWGAGTDYATRVTFPIGWPSMNGRRTPAATSSRPALQSTYRHHGPILMIFHGVSSALLAPDISMVGAMIGFEDNAHSKDTTRRKSRYLCPCLQP